MPIYEYGCPDCGKEFEALQKFSDDPIRVCPSCSKENVRKKISATSFTLKGGGWYKDHYGLKSGSSSEASGGSSSSAPTSSSASTPAAPAASSAPAAAPAASSSSSSSSGT